MEVVTIESRAFKQLMEKLDTLLEYICSMGHPVTTESDDEGWVDSQKNLPVSQD